jgi:hypothetical protein
MWKAVSAMSVRALRMTVLKNAGSLARKEWLDLKAEKIQRVKCFVDMSVEVFAASNFRTPARPAGFENVWRGLVGGRRGLLRHVGSDPGSKHQSERGWHLPDAPLRI